MTPPSAPVPAFVRNPVFVCSHGGPLIRPSMRSRGQVCSRDAGPFARRIEFEVVGPTPLRALPFSDLLEVVIGAQSGPTQGCEIPCDIGA